MLDDRGGCGIRVVSAEEGVEEVFKWFVSIRASCTNADMVHFRCMNENPSDQLFAEKALYEDGSTSRSRSQTTAQGT